MAGPGIAVHGALPDAEVVELMEQCYAVCLAGEEDFGIVAVEAHAAGKPVVAFARGGALESVEEGITGVFFHAQTVEALAAAIVASEQLQTAPVEIAERARRFGRPAFRTNLLAAIAGGLARHGEA
jgi:glycosyltransferase involved in cell wall biosynthesis